MCVCVLRGASVSWCVLGASIEYSVWYLGTHWSVSFGKATCVCKLITKCKYSKRYNITAILFSTYSLCCTRCRCYCYCFFSSVFFWNGGKATISDGCCSHKCLDYIYHAAILKYSATTTNSLVNRIGQQTNVYFIINKIQAKCDAYA